MVQTAAERAKRYRDGRRHKIEAERDAVTLTQEQGEAIMEVANPARTFLGDPNCGCRMCANWKAKGKDTALLNHSVLMNANELAACGPHARNRVPLPGDMDYKGLA